MRESSKAMRRRFIEDATGVFPWMKIFKGEGIDVGCGDDPLPFKFCKPFDKLEGDASDLTKYFKPDTFKWLHSSQCLEHLDDPVAALRTWITVVKPGGWLVISVPDWYLYEGQQWPSRYNPDHRSTWSLYAKDSPAPTHVFVPDFLKSFEDVADVKRCQLVDTRYNYKIGAIRDQTLPEDAGVEAFIEFVLEKK